MTQANKWISRIIAELSLTAHCRAYHLPLWQCPQFLFVLLGGITVLLIFVFYLVFSPTIDPYSVAFIAIAIATFSLIQTFIILHAFERSAEANRMQVEFINIATHQLRSPVTAARWALDFLVSDASRGLSAEGQNCVHIARDAVGNIGQLVNSVLRTVRIESGTSNLRPEPLYIPALVKEVADAARPFARAGHNDIKLLVPQEPFFVRVDHEHMRFVLEHLLDNALRYSKRAGAVEVRVKGDARHVRVEVRDEGEGIPLHEQPHVFEKFFRATNAHSLAPSGAGLSLYASRAIIRASGGDMGFNSTEGEGSIFWFTLPRIAGDVASSKQT